MAGTRASRRRRTTATRSASYWLKALLRPLTPKALAAAWSQSLVIAGTPLGVTIVARELTHWPWTSLVLLGVAVLMTAAGAVGLWRERTVGVPEVQLAPTENTPQDESEPPKRHVQMPHPYIEDGQLVLTLRDSESTSAHPLQPLPVDCHVVRDGKTWKAEDGVGWAYPAKWMMRLYYPRNFRGAPPLIEGDYEVRWLEPRFSQDRKLVGYDLGRATTVHVVRDDDGQLSVTL